MSSFRLGPVSRKTILNNGIEFYRHSQWGRHTFSQVFGTSKVHPCYHQERSRKAKTSVLYISVITCSNTPYLPEVLLSSATILSFKHQLWGLSASWTGLSQVTCHGQKGHYKDFGFALSKMGSHWRVWGKCVTSITLARVTAIQYIPSCELENGAPFFGQL